VLKNKLNYEPMQKLHIYIFLFCKTQALLLAYTKKKRKEKKEKQKKKNKKNEKKETNFVNKR